MKSPHEGVYFRYFTPTPPSNCRGDGMCRLANDLLATSSTHAHGRFERVIDPPLEASQSTDHDNTGTKTLGGKGSETGLGGDGTDGLAPVSRLAH